MSESFPPSPLQQFEERERERREAMTTITREQIEQIAKHGVLYVFHGNEREQIEVWPLCDAALEREALRVALLQERERCAKVCNRIAAQYSAWAAEYDVVTDQGRIIYMHREIVANSCATAIRARPDPVDLDPARRIIEDAKVSAQALGLAYRITNGYVPGDYIDIAKMLASELIRLADVQHQNREAGV